MDTVQPPLAESSSHASRLTMERRCFPRLALCLRDNNFHSLLYFSKQWDALSGPALACIPSSRLPLFLRSSVRARSPCLTSLWRNQTWFSELIQQFSAPAGVNNTIVETTLRLKWSAFSERTRTHPLVTCHMCCKSCWIRGTRHCFYLFIK